MDIGKLIKMAKTKSSTFHCCVALVLFTLSLVSLAMVIEVKDEQSPSAGKRRGYVSLSRCNHCWFAFVLWCGYYSVSFQSFV